MPSELQQYYRMFNNQVMGGYLCKGEDCNVWFLSDVDTWHECPCNKQKKIPHPEDNPEDY